jgi:hypothetical protein
VQPPLTQVLSSIARVPSNCSVAPAAAIREAMTVNHFCSALCSADRTILVTRSGAGGSIWSARHRREQFRADLVPVPLRVRDVGGQPFLELFLIGDRALAEPEVTADLGTVVLRRAAGLLVEPRSDAGTFRIDVYLARLARVNTLV